MLTHSSHAATRTFRMPGQEIWGKWKVVSYDVRSQEKPLGDDFLKQMNEREAFLPVGQVIEIEGGYEVSYVLRSVTTGQKIPYSAPDVTLRFLAPNSPDFCKNTKWDFLCDDPKKLTVDQSFGGKIFFFIGTRDVTRKMLWPSMSAIEYQLVLDMDRFFFLNLISPDRLVAHLYYFASDAADGVPVGVIFERIEN
jgi:hypothetical protein